MFLKKINSNFKSFKLNRSLNVIGERFERLHGNTHHALINFAFIASSSLLSSITYRSFSFNFPEGAFQYYIQFKSNKWFTVYCKWTAI